MLVVWVGYFFFFFLTRCRSRINRRFEGTKRIRGYAFFLEKLVGELREKASTFSNVWTFSMLHGGIIIHGHETKPREIWSTLPKIRKGFYENLALKSRLTPLQFEIHTGFCQNVERSLGKSRMNCKSETLVWISSSEIYAFQHFKFKNEILRRKIFKLNSP